MPDCTAPHGRTYTDLRGELHPFCWFHAPYCESRHWIVRGYGTAKQRTRTPSSHHRFEKSWQRREDWSERQEIEWERTNPDRVGEFY